MDKKAIRRAMRLGRRSIAPGERRRREEAITEHLLGHISSGSGRVIMGYTSFDGEVDLSRLYDLLQEGGVALVMPRIMDTDSRRLGLFLMPRPWRNHLQEGSYGILEPSAALVQVEPLAIDCVLVPGVAFDLAGGRLGFGGGYYDRFLPQLRLEAGIIGVAFALQIVESIPCQEHDVRMGRICTEKGLLVV